MIRLTLRPISLQRGGLMPSILRNVSPTVPRMQRKVFFLCRMAALAHDYMRSCQAAKSQVGRTLPCLTMCRALCARRDCTLSTRSEPDLWPIAIELKRTQPEHCVPPPLQAFAQLTETSAIQAIVRKQFNTID